MSEIKEITLNKENMADIRCSKCLKNRSVDMSKYKNMDRPIRFKAKCSCGHSDTVFLNRRDKYRKPTDFFGVYTNLSSGKEGQKGEMTVLDVSRAGLRMEISHAKLKVKEHDVAVVTGEQASFEHKIKKPVDEINVGDKLLVEFRLDDTKQTLIKKEVIIRWMKMPFIGVEFSSQSLYDGSLGFYMMDDSPTILIEE
jgi:hypothetical protein